ncbi:MAG: DUF5110 domain-containing protein [Burkholderiales bacterium]|nr:DUF5110 domain-containing protein [Burkholderiales bacterium]
MRNASRVTEKHTSLKLTRLGILLAMSVCASATNAQNAARQFESFADKGSYLEITTNDGQYRIRPYTGHIVETSFIPKGEQFDPVSHAVVLAPQAVQTQLRDTDSQLQYQVRDMEVDISKSPFQISYRYKGKPLISEKNGYVHQDKSERLDFNLDNSEALYGAGERALGMNRRGNRLPLYNKAHYGYEEHSTQMNYAMPLVFSSKMYGIHFDNAPIGFLDLDSKKDNVLAYETISGRKTYQVIAGDNWQELVSSYTALTGRQPLPPRWAFGNFASRFGYHSEAQARAVLEQYAAEKIPVDAIIFDLYWFGKDIKGTMGNLAFDHDSFPHPRRMIADFASQGVKTILITEPFILTTSGRWDEAVQKKILATDKDGKALTYDFYFGHTGLIDLFNPVARDWFWNIYKDLRKDGVAGWWGDLGEPEVHPAALMHASGSADQVHNIYGHEWAKLIAEGYQREFPKERPFILMRSGYSGSQRYGMIPWSGDVNRTWGGLRSQPEIALQMGMQGLAYMHSDLGGFAGANLDDELYVRWLQYGVFQPVFRPHAQEEVASEPVFREPHTRALAKAAILLRYRLLPYNYTLAFDNHLQGLPLMRPLFYDEPDNPALLTVADTYLWGHDFLVHPVLHAAEKQSSLYFPRSSDWFDFVSDQKYAGGSTQTVDVISDHIPVFVRAGAFIPMSPPMQNTSQYSTRELVLHYYHDPKVSQSSGKLYDDDGVTAAAYEHGAYAMLHFDSALHRDQLTIRLSEQRGAAYAAQDRHVQLAIHNVQHKPRQVSVHGRTSRFDWDASTHILHLDVTWNRRTEEKILVNLQR